MRATLDNQLFNPVRLAFSPDGKTLAMGCVDSGIRFWDLASGRVTTALVDHCGWTSALRYAPDGRTLALGSTGGLVQLWRITYGQAPRRLRQFVNPDSVQSLALSPDGSTLATGGPSYGIKLWDVESGRERQRVPNQSQYILAMEFSADGQTLIVAKQKGVIQIWNLADGRELATIRGNPDLGCAAISPGGRFVARGHDAVVKVWDLSQLGLADDLGNPETKTRDR
jgi:WD40 repeat protein